MKRLPFVLVILLGVAGCNPPQSHVTADGKPCHPIGYSWRPVWVTPDNTRAC